MRGHGKWQRMATPHLGPPHRARFDGRGNIADRLATRPTMKLPFFTGFRRDQCAR
jgi:hypothetical protein